MRQLSTISRIRSFFSLVKFEHTLISLPFAIIGFVIGIKDLEYFPHERIVIFTFISLILARNAAMSFNRIIDHKIDKLNQRTSNREIPAGVIKLEQAIAFCVVNSILFIICTYFINNIVFFLSPIALFIVFFYSLTKRFTWLSHFVLGLSLSIVPAGSYIAVTETLSIEIMLISTSVIFWIAGFDIIYAIQDINFDQQHKLYSIPAKFGFKNSIKLAFLMHIIFLLLLLCWWSIFYSKKWIVFVGIILFFVIIFRHYFLYNRSAKYYVFENFILSNSLGAILFSIFYTFQFIIK